MSKKKKDVIPDDFIDRLKEGKGIEGKNVKELQNIMGNRASGTSSEMPEFTGLPSDVRLWLNGSVDVPPGKVRSFLEDLHFKLIWAQGYLQLSQLIRTGHQMQHLGEIGNLLFTEDAYDEYSTDQLIRLYEKVYKDIQQALDAARKFADQNGDVLKTLAESKGEDLVEILRNLDKDVVQKIQGALRGV